MNSGSCSQMSSSWRWLIGSFSNDDGDGNENSKKAISLEQQEDLSHMNISPVVRSESFCDN